MTDHKLSESIKRLLHDHSFVMWCMTPTEELDAHWQNWLESHADEEIAMNEARQILKSARLNQYTLPLDESKALLDRIKKSTKTSRNKQYKFLVGYAAASILLLGMIGTWMFQTTQPSAPHNLMAETEIGIDSTQTEVTLIMENSETVELDDNAVISYDSDVTVQSKQKETTILKKITGQKEGKPTSNTLVVPRGRRSSLILADGSKIWVNAGSVLHFPTAFDSQKRTIQVKGEIYIEVAKDPSRPFYVETKDFIVNVLGTKFNISAYTDDLSQSVVLVEGSVKVNARNKEEICLTPSQKLTLAQEGTHIERVDVYDYISWKDGLLQFKDVSMEEILQRLSRYYNVSIKSAPGIAKRRCSGKLVLFDDVKQVLDTFSMLYNVTCRFESDTILIE